MAATGDVLPEPKDPQGGSARERRQLYASGYSICNGTKLALLSGAAVLLLSCMPARAVEGVSASPVEGSELESYRKEGVYFRIHSDATALLDDEDYDQRDMKLRHQQAQRRERLYSGARGGRGLAAGTVANISVEGRTFFIPSLYFIKITLGSRRQEFRVQLDTGSDLFWVPCNCIVCATESDYYEALFPFYDPSASATAANISCGSRECAAIQESFGGPFPNACRELVPFDTLCEYNVTYGDGSFTAGDVYRDVLHLPANPGVSGPVIFGCGEDQGGNLVDGTNPVEGLMGLSRSGLSVVRQLAADARLSLADSFSLCLEGRTKGGHMALGRTSLAAGAVYVPLITDRVYGSFYYIGVTLIAVNGATLPLTPEQIAGGEQSATGGVILDSGSSVTELPAVVYDAILAQVATASGAIFQTANLEGLPANCTTAPGGTSVPELNAQFPGIELRIGNVAWTIPPWNYLQADESAQSSLPANTVCFAATPGDTFIIGDTWLRNHDILFDNVNDRIGFYALNCTTLTPLNTSTAAPLVSPSSVPVLAKVKAGLDPSGALLASWKPSRPCAIWRGLTCDHLGHVTSMNFGPSLIFSGSLVDAIGSLPYLTTLVVRTDGFVPGSVIPVTIAKLRSLKKLVLSGYTRTAVLSVALSVLLVSVGTGLSGSLPAGIAALPSLTYLDLSNNTLGGPLPSFAAAKKLVHLDLSGNNLQYASGLYFGFDGATPTFGAQNALTYMNLASNNFNSTGSLGVLTKLTYLNLAVNPLQTFVASEIKSASLTYLNLSATYLAGPLPDLAHVKSLQYLDLSGYPGSPGSWNGTLRADYGSLKNLRLLNLPFSFANSLGLQGPIPRSYGNLTNLVTLSIGCPAFSGTVDEAFPSTLGNLQKLRSLTIYALGLYRPAGLPSFVGKLTGLRKLSAYGFSGNATTGAYPANLAKLQRLTSLTLQGLNTGEDGGDLQGGVLNGSLPQFVLSLKSLQKLDLSRNTFSGRVWPNLRTLKNLRYIDLSVNFLSGALGDVLSANPNWETAILLSSGLGGGLPSGIGSLKGLQYLSLGYLLNGTIPSSFSKLTALRYLSLDNNNFYGAVPDLSATKLAYLSLDTNNFSGALPRLPKTLQVLNVRFNHFTAIPDIFQGLNALLYADFNLAGTIRALPPSLFRLPKLQYLSASLINLTSIPSNIGGAQALTSLYLSSNAIVQPFPGGLQYLKNLNYLDVSHNQLTGPLPQLPDITTPASLDFSYNAFSGTLPRDVFNHENLVVVDVSFNQLSGPVPDIYDFGFYFPGRLDSNYFTGRPLFLNASNGLQSCISSADIIPHTSLNCLSFQGTNCTATPQRPASQCAAFCGDTSPEGPCAGHGVCYLKASAPVCICNHGYSPATRNNVPTCVAGAHHPGQGHHPPGVGHHPSPPPPSGARRLMQQ